MQTLRLGRTIHLLDTRSYHLFFLLSFFWDHSVIQHLSVIIVVQLPSIAIVMWGTHCSFSLVERSKMGSSFFPFPPNQGMQQYNPHYMAQLHYGSAGYNIGVSKRMYYIGGFLYILQCKSWNCSCLRAAEGNPIVHSGIALL